MVKALLLARTLPRTRAAGQAKKLIGVRDAFEVTGRFDFVALLETKNFQDLKQTIYRIQGLPGVKRTETLIHLE